MPNHPNTTTPTPAPTLSAKELSEYQEFLNWKAEQMKEEEEAEKEAAIAMLNNLNNLISGLPEMMKAQAPAPVVAKSKEEEGKRALRKKELEGKTGARAAMKRHKLRTAVGGVVVLAAGGLAARKGAFGSRAQEMFGGGQKLPPLQG